MKVAMPLLGRHPRFSTMRHLFFVELHSVVGSGNLISILGCHRESYSVKSDYVFHSLTTLSNSLITL